MKCLPGGRTVFGEVHPVLTAINREIDLDHIAMGGKQIHKIVVSSGSSQIVHV